MPLPLFSSALFDCYHFALALMNRWKASFSLICFVVSRFMTSSDRVKPAVNRLDPIKGYILIVSQKARDRIILIWGIYLDDINVVSSTVSDVVAGWPRGNIILKLLNIRSLINGFDRVLVSNLSLLSRRIIFIPYRMIRFVKQILFHLIVVPFSWTWYQTRMLSLSMHRIFHRHDISGSSYSCVFYRENIFAQLETINNLLGFPLVFRPPILIKRIIFT